MEDDDIIMTLQLMVLADRLETPKFVSPLVCGRPGQIYLDSLSKSSCCCHRLNFPGGGDPSTAWPGQRPPAPADIWNQFWRRSGGGGGHPPAQGAQSLYRYQRLGAFFCCESGQIRI